MIAFRAHAIIHYLMCDKFNYSFRVTFLSLLQNLNLRKFHKNLLNFEINYWKVTFITINKLQKDFIHSTILCFVIDTDFNLIVLSIAI